MQSQTLDLVKDIVFILFFLVGTLWMWNIVKLPQQSQWKLENIFKRSRNRFKWLFLIGFIALLGLFVWQEVMKH